MFYFFRRELHLRLKGRYGIRVDESGEGQDRLDAVEYTIDGYGVAIDVFPPILVPVEP
jgi:hypothetical protein